MFTNIIIGLYWHSSSDLMRPVLPSFSLFRKDYYLRLFQYKSGSLFSKQSCPVWPQRLISDIYLQYLTDFNPEEEALLLGFWQVIILND